MTALSESTAKSITLQYLTGFLGIAIGGCLRNCLKVSPIQCPALTRFRFPRSGSYFKLNIINRSTCVKGRCSIRLSYGRSLTIYKKWSGQRDSNPRHPAPKAGALPDCAMPRYPVFHSRFQRNEHACNGTIQTGWANILTRTLKVNVCKAL